ncbi:hypothetical protein SLEP1_g24584 [Rubroshorea leprosula]|uniref:Uncharacterized protein n=1 Tax=Rubroshorea leprosula TaxID=152421 RepID=A0AAV5JQD7_9ROSI|nr:hypothetical protein SLEP1_g24584 [Rubroshorea leprosula]
MRILGIFRFPLNFSCTCRRPLPPARSGSAAGIFGSRSFCQLALRLSLRFYTSEVSKFMVMPIQFLKACFDLFLKWWGD